MLTPQFVLLLNDEIVVDNFAGGGGASTGIERAIGRPVDVALNHDPKALAMHRMNHPQTVHYCEDIRAADPVRIAAGRPVGLAWFSPDCKHFSKAKGGKPRDKNIRGLAWVAIKWANKVSPRVIILENVEEFQTWGPLDKDGSPKKECSGLFFRYFVGALQRRGYSVDFRELRACDYGAPTIRKRFFLVARRDGLPIVWPTPTHGAGRAKKYRAVAECLDFSLPCPSIFLTHAQGLKVNAKRPLADATQKRIARGIEKFILRAEKPFVVCKGDFACLTRYNGGAKGCALDAPVNTISARTSHGKGGGNGFGLVECKTAHITTLRNNETGLVADSPLSTVTASGSHHALTCCYLAQHNAGFCSTVGHSAEKPLSTLTGTGAQQNLVACALATNTTGHSARSANKPCATLTTGSQQMLVEASIVEPLTPQKAKKARRVAKWLRYHGVKVKGEFATVAGLVIWDIGLRMLRPRECYLAQGFPPNYIIDRGLTCEEPHKEIKLTTAEMMRMCGNSVCPPISEAIVRANFQEPAFVREAV